VALSEPSAMTSFKVYTKAYPTIHKLVHRR